MQLLLHQLQAMIKNGLDQQLKMMLVIKIVINRMVMFVQDCIKLNVAKNIGVFKMKNYMMFGTAEVDCINK
jgi:hypothetical protein